MSGRAASLIVDETPEALCHHQCSGSQLDDLDIATGNKQVKRAAANASEATGIINAHADRFDPEVARGSIVDQFYGSCWHRLRSKPFGVVTGQGRAKGELPAHHRLCLSRMPSAHAT